MKVRDLQADIKITFKRHLKAFGTKDINWIHLGQNRENRQAQVNVVIELSLSIECREFLGKH